MNFKQKQIGCEKVVWGNDYIGTLDCGDEMGIWMKKSWVMIGYYLCTDCKPKYKINLNINGWNVEEI